jgi:hypothetical protein
MIGLLPVSLTPTVFYTGGLPNADWSISILLAWPVVLTGSALGCAALMSFVRMPRRLTRAGSAIFVVAGVAFGALSSRCLHSAYT